jgi:hypothetical protein
MIKKIKLTLQALKKEHETYLAYKRGYKINAFGDLKNAASRWQGLFFRVLFFLRFTMKNLSLKKNKKSKKDILTFSESNNQFVSLRETVIQLVRQGIKTENLVTLNISNLEDIYYSKDFSLVKFSFFDVLAAYFLLLVKGPTLYVRARKISKPALKKYFDKFCHSYVYLPYFFEILEQTQPKLIITSNDHNVANRCFRLAASMLNIETAYMQHASVTKDFPPLDFTYAFLDGQQALDIYVECENFNKSIKGNQYTAVLLSGQKKKVENTDKNIKTNNLHLCIGVGVNTLDDIFHVKNLLGKLEIKGVSCLVRTHPSQRKTFVEELQLYCNNNQYVKVLGAKEQPLTQFLAQINLLITANTSLHLEAALIGIPTYYYEMSDSISVPDHYGYLKHGISKRLPSQLLENLNIEEFFKLMYLDKDRKKAIKYYSETFDTRWQGKEGELTALVLKRLLNKQGIKDLCSKIELDKTVYKVF